MEIWLVVVWFCTEFFFFYLPEVKINGPLRKKPPVRKNTNQSSMSCWCPHVVTCTGQTKVDGKNTPFCWLASSWGGQFAIACPVKLSPFLSYPSEKGCSLSISLRFLNNQAHCLLIWDIALWYHRFYFLSLSTALHCHPFAAHISHHSCGCVSVQFQKSLIEIIC